MHISGDIFDAEDLKALSVSNIICFKHTRLVSCDVERTFYGTQLKMSFVVQGNTASLSVRNTDELL